MKVISFRARNFRGFIDTGPIVQKPINLLIGRNSIGKSSYARIFPLFRQGIGINKRSPLIWNGSLVDYGSFNDVISRYTDEKHIEFQFRIKPSAINTRKNIYTNQTSTNILYSDSITVKIKMSCDEDTENTIISNLSIETEHDAIDYSFGNEGEVDTIKYNGNIRVTKRSYDNYIVENRLGFLLPRYEYSMKTKDGLVYRAYPPTRTSLYLFLRVNLHHRFTIEKIQDICSKLNIIGDSEKIISYCKNLPFDYSSWNDFIYKIEHDQVKRKEFTSLVNISSSLNFLTDIDHCLEQFFSNVTYIHPLRAAAERYYRKQDLSIENIDSRGANLPFFLSSLPKGKLKELNEWLHETLSVRLQIVSNSGHVMIKVEDIESNRTDNIADMGFGFSQVLPLAVQAWISKYFTKRLAANQKQILVWEQPELHLHPAMQRKLARLISNTTKDTNISFYIETHSTSIINELGNLIIDEELHHSNIRVLLFQQKDDGSTEVKKTGFNNDGELEEFPIGFLS